MKKLHNELIAEYYTLDPSMEVLILQYAKTNWNNADFQEAIKEVAFGSFDCLNWPVTLKR